MKVKVTNYNPDWVNLYNIEKESIVKALGNIPHQIRHIGSTAVPGLGAKPVIDILLGINSYSELKNIIPVLNQLGFEYRNFECYIPQWAYFTKPSYCHVHCVEITSDFYKRQITFRDYLRAHDNVREEYYKLKKNLAEINWENPMDYSFAKDEFIRRTERKAIEYITTKIEIAEAKAFVDLYSNAPEQYQIESNISFKNFGQAILQCPVTQPSDIINRVVNFGVLEEASEDFIDFILDYYISNNSKKIILHLSQIAKPENISVSLEEKGFKLHNSMPKFYRDTFSVPDLQTGFEIKTITAEQAEDFAEIVTPGMKKVFIHPIGKDNWYFYVAYDNEKAIAAACMYIYDDTAWFGMATTIPEYRNKGAQSSLIAKRLNDAKLLGCKWIASETLGNETNPSYHNLLRFGFNLMYKRPIFVFKHKVID